MSNMFASRFWSSGYNEGLDTLLNKSGQGIVENNESLALAQARADAEEAHGIKLQQLADQSAPKRSGFARDDGATMRRAYEGLLQQMRDEGRQHTHIAESIGKMVVTPFQKWANDHVTRIERSKGESKRYSKAYERESAAVHRAQQRYFNRCRSEEDSDGENSGDNSTLASTTGNSRRMSSASTVIRRSSADSMHTNNIMGTPSSNGLDENELAPQTSEELTFGARLYSADESQEIVRQMLTEIPQVSTKVPVLGVYDHTVTGSQIVEWSREHTAADSLSDAESAGQKLVNDGFMRLIGQFGSRFVNSTVFIYQWRPHAYEFAGLSIAAETGASTAGGLYADSTSRWGAMRTNDVNNGNSLRELDQKYRKAVLILDKARVDSETMMFEQFTYLERCERERSAAFKAVLLDFAAAVSNVVPALSASVDQMLLYHEIADVERDSRFFVENYQTGRYDPKVIVYDNYYSSVEGAAIFGSDLDLRSRADKKRVPIFVSGTLSSLDSAYPLMENDTARSAAWQTPLSMSIRAAQEARQQLNSSSLSVQMLKEYFSGVPAVTIAQTLKLYFSELPSSVIGGQLYDLLRGVYTKFGGDSEEKVQARLQSLQNTLAQLTSSHIAVLDASTAHISRLVTIANASRHDIELIAHQWGSALCRPKVPSALSLDDTFPEQILSDLLDNRERIFGESKRHAAAVLSPQDSVSSTTSSRFRSLSSRAATNTALKSEARTKESTPIEAPRSRALTGMSGTPPLSVAEDIKEPGTPKSSRSLSETRDSRANISRPDPKEPQSGKSSSPETDSKKLYQAVNELALQQQDETDPEKFTDAEEAPN